MKILSIVGARPQFIKLAPLSEQIRRHFPEIIVHTGQHFDEEMSDLFFRQLEIPYPDYNLGIAGGNHGEQTGRMLISLEEVMLKEKPDLVIVFGDTNSTLAGSLAAAKLNIPAVHVEAGLRSFNRTMPEEINRIVSDHTCDHLFAPTATARQHLINEGLGEKTHLSGDIMVDALQINRSKAQERPFPLPDGAVSDGYYLLTLHRPYTVDDPKNLALLLGKLSNLRQDIVFPVHPRTRQVIENNGIVLSGNIHLIKPQGYLDFIRLEMQSRKIITDSGGIQKEAYILQKPCITIRPETEWVETVEDGWNILLLPTAPDFEERIQSFQPANPQREAFGSNVAEKMLDLIKRILHKEEIIPNHKKQTNLKSQTPTRLSGMRQPDRPKRD